MNPEIASLDILPVASHYKNGEYIKEHLHLSLAFLFEASEFETLQHKADENSAVKWFDLATLGNLVSEKEMLAVYNKIVQKL